jgi:hypothetical protein
MKKRLHFSFSLLQLTLMIITPALGSRKVSQTCGSKKRDMINAALYK